MILPYTAVPPRTAIAAVGSALVDMCLLEDDTFLNSSGAQKGGMTLVDSQFNNNLLSLSKKTPVIVPGGSACNTVLGVGKLGGQARFIGKRGNDHLGKLFEQGLIDHKVEPFMQISDSPTGHVLSIITPDAQRSMFTFLGASAETSPEEIVAEMFKNTAIVHIEGYLLFNPQLMLTTLKAAKASGALISLDLASFTVVESAKELIEEICSEYIDIIIANEDEARVFTGHSDEKTALKALSQKADITVLKIGKRGSFITYQDETTVIKPIGTGTAIDTTGAGDLWAAGFLFGLVNGYPLAKCGELGSACGYEVCQVIGASIPDEGWDRIKQLL